MPQARFELARPHGHQILSLTRLPFHHQGVLNRASGGIRTHPVQLLKLPPPAAGLRSHGGCGGTRTLKSTGPKPEGCAIRHKLTHPYYKVRAKGLEPSKATDFKSVGYAILLDSPHPRGNRNKSRGCRSRTYKNVYACPWCPFVLRLMGEVASGDCDFGFGARMPLPFG